MKTQKKENHAEQNAISWAASIAGLVAALECDFDRLQDLRDERAALVEELEASSAEYSPHGYDVAKKALDSWDDENLEEMHALREAATVDGEEFKEREHVEQRIQESPLSVHVRSGWVQPGDKMEAEEFEVLLSTGGPALRIMGELDEHNQPIRAWLEYQDWGTPWTHHYAEGLADTLLTFCQQFYFGE